MLGTQGKDLPRGRLIWALTLAAMFLLVPSNRGQKLLNIDYGSAQNPVFSVKTGLAATGLSASDYWNLYSRDDGNGGFRTGGTLPNLLWSDQSPSGANLSVQNASGAWYTLNGDPMFQSYLYPGTRQGPITSVLTQLPAEAFDLYVYAHGQPPNENAIIEVLVAGQSVGAKSTSSAEDWDAVGWGENRQFVIFRSLSVPTGQDLTVLSKPGVTGLAVINGMQLSFGRSVPQQQPLQITRQPSSYTVSPGHAVTFTVEAIGSGQLRYQWYHNGNPIPGALGAAYPVASAAESDAGSYQAVVSDDFTSLSSGTVQLTVTPSARLLLNVDYGSDQNPNFPKKSGAGAVGNSEDLWNLYSRDDGRGGFRVQGSLKNLIWSDGAPSTIQLSVTNAAGAWYTFNKDPMFLSYLYPLGGGGPDITSVLSGLPSGSYDFYIYAHGQPPQENGVLQLTVGSVNYGSQSTSSAANWDPGVWAEGGQYVRFSGIPVSAGDQVTIRSMPGAAGLAVINGLQAIYTPAQLNLTIGQQPADVQALEGDTAILSISAISGSPVRYQWFKDGAAIAGATGPTLTFQAVRVDQSGAYGVAVSDAITSLSSSVAHLTVSPLPPVAGKMINIDYGAHLNPGFSIKVGPAAVGAPGDVWNLYSRDNPDGTWRGGGTLSPLKWNTGEVSPASLTVSNAIGAWYTLDLDPMFLSYLYPGSRVGPIVSEITRLQPGAYDVYVYAHGLPASENAAVEVTVGQQSYGSKSTSDSANWDLPGWVEGNEYVVFRGVNVVLGQPLRIISHGGDSGLAVINGAQIVLAGSTSAPSTVNDGIPDEWRLRYFGSVSDPKAAATADPDGDGADNYQEFLDGTDPTAKEIGGLPLRVETYAGSTLGDQDGPLASALLANPSTLTMHRDGRLFFTQADIQGFSTAGTNGHSIRVIENGVVSTWAGSQQPGLVEGPRQDARFKGPMAIVFDSLGNAFVSDRLNHRIRKIDTQGMVSTFAGSAAGFQDGIGMDAKFSSPIGMCIDGQDNLYVADFDNYRIRKITPSAEVSTYAGTGEVGAVDGSRTNATFAGPHYVAAAPDGALYLADWLNGRLRKISSNGAVSTMDGGRPYIESVATDTLGNVYATVPPDMHRLIKYRTDGTIEWQMGNSLGYLDGPAAQAQFRHYGVPLVLADGNILLTDGDNHIRRIITGQHLDPLLAISPDPGLFYGSVNIALHARGNGTITYTVDGSEPSSSSPPYASPFSLTHSAIVKARLFINGIAVSPVVSGEFDLQPSGNLKLLNVDFGAHLNPNFSAKTGLAAVGNSPQDQWNLYSRDAADGQWLQNGAISNLRWSDGRLSAGHLAVQNAGGAWYTQSSDPMFQSYLYPLGRSGNIVAQFAKLPQGVYDAYVYAHGLPPQENAVVSVSATGHSTGAKTTSVSPDWNVPSWIEGDQFVVFRDIPVGPDGNLTVTSQPGASGLAIMNGIQLVLKAGEIPPFNPTVADWTFEEGHPGDAALAIKDFSGRQNDASQIIGAPQFVLTSPAVAGFTSLQVGATGSDGFKAGPTQDFVFGTEFSMEALFRPDGPGNPDAQSLIVLQDPAGARRVYDLQYDPTLPGVRFLAFGSGGNVFSIAAPWPSDNLSHHLGVVFKNQAVTLYLDKAVLTNALCPVQPPIGFAGGLTVLVAANPTVPSKRFQGVLDRVKLSAQALAPEEFFEIRKDPAPLVIVRDLQDVVAQRGDRVILSVEATGAPPLTYQWALNGTIIPDKTSNTLILENVQALDGGSYSVTITSQIGQQASGKAIVTVQIPVDANLPVVVRDPVTTRVNPGESVTLSVDAVGPGPLSFQWQRNGQNIPGASTTALVIPAASGSDGGIYRALVSNPFGSVLSASAVVIIQDTIPPEVTITSPSGEVTGINYTLTGTIRDNSALFTAQWLRDGQIIGAVGVTNGQFQIQGLMLELGTNRFAVQVIDSGGNIARADAVVVLRPTRFLSLPDGAMVQEGERFELPIQLASSGDVAAVTFEITYDTNYFSDTTLQWIILPLGALGEVNGAVPGTIRASLALAGQTIPPGTNTVAHLNLRLRSIPATLDSVLNLRILGIYAANGDPVTSGTEAQSGLVTLIPRKVTGDNNANDRLDVSDAAMIMRLVTQLDPVRPWDIAANDLNNNGQLDAGDVLRVLRAAAHIDSQPVVALPLGRQAIRGAAASIGALSVTADQGVLTPGNLLKVHVGLAGVEKAILGASLRIDYPASFMRLEDASSHVPGPIIPATALNVWNVSPAISDYQNQDGSLYVAFSSPSAWPTNAGELLTLTFRVGTGAAAHTQILHFSEGEISTGVDLAPLPPADLVFHGTEPQPPRLAGVSLQANIFKFTLEGDVGDHYRLEVSEDLLNWAPLIDLVNDHGSIDVTDRNPAAYRSRYYRATLPR